MALMSLNKNIKTKLHDSFEMRQLICIFVTEEMKS